MTKTELFLKLAQPNADGVSRWVSVEEFVGEYAELRFGNGASWARKESNLARRYIIEFDKTKTKGNGIDRIRLVGNNYSDYSQYINADIIGSNVKFCVEFYSFCCMIVVRTAMWYR